jgi:hypothetical protein
VHRDQEHNERARRSSVTHMLQSESEEALPDLGQKSRICEPRELSDDELDLLDHLSRTRW